MVDYCVKFGQIYSFILLNIIQLHIKIDQILNIPFFGYLFLTYESAFSN